MKTKTQKLSDGCLTMQAFYFGAMILIGLYVFTLRITGSDDLTLFNEHRKKVCESYAAAATIIVDKGEKATEQEQEAFLKAALDLENLQKICGKIRNLRLVKTYRQPMNPIALKRFNHLFEIMEGAKIKTGLPVSKDEVREAYKYINALEQLMHMNIEIL